MKMYNKLIDLISLIEIAFNNDHNSVNNSININKRYKNRLKIIKACNKECIIKMCNNINRRTN